jgi:formylglycine-generating enzyme required for sulfatase activity
MRGIALAFTAALLMNFLFDPAASAAPATPAVHVGVQPLSAAQERALKPKDTFKVCDTCPEMVVVPAGSSIMGSPASERGRTPKEGPPHRVTFAKAFAVGKFAITFDEWDACVADGDCKGYRPSDEGWGRGRRPVINIGGNHARAYLTWLSGKTGKTYRLLSEAEREYVTRAGSTTPFWWGSTISTGQANYNGNKTYGRSSKGEYRRQTVPVDSFKPNPWGLYQVHGNVWEMTEDCENQDYRGAPTDGSAWKAGECGCEVVRGGSWDYHPSQLRSAERMCVDLGEGGSPSFGLRVARTLHAE